MQLTKSMFWMLVAVMVLNLITAIGMWSISQRVTVLENRP